MQSPSVTEQLDESCRRVAIGRQAARDLATLVSACGLKEAEFRLLWFLRSDNAQFDQTRLSDALGCSPAQVSTLVEHLCGQGHIVGQPAPDDRRRNLWQITTAGRQLLETIVRLAATKSQQLPMVVHTCSRKSA